MKVEVEILNRKFPLICEAPSEDYVLKVANYFNERIKEIQETGVTDPLSLAILAGLNIVDELFEMRSKYEKKEKAIEEALNLLSEVEI